MHVPEAVELPALTPLREHVPGVEFFLTARLTFPTQLTCQLAKFLPLK